MPAWLWGKILNLGAFFCFQTSVFGGGTEIQILMRSHVSLRSVLAQSAPCVAPKGLPHKRLLTQLSVDPLETNNVFFSSFPAVKLTQVHNFLNLLLATALFRWLCGGRTLGGEKETPSPYFMLPFRRNHQFPWEHASHL